jgi:hypothetical protein
MPCLPRARAWTAHQEAARAHSHAAAEASWCWDARCERHDDKHVNSTCLQVRSALSRTRKEETIDKLVAGLESSVCVFGVRYKGISVSCWRPH